MFLGSRLPAAELAIDPGPGSEALTLGGTCINYYVPVARRSNRGGQPDPRSHARATTHHLPPALPRPGLTMKAKLIGLDSHGPAIHIVLDTLPVVIGRNPEADVRVDDRWISRVHCEIGELDGPLVVRDLDSRNGTAVNGQYITESHLLPGDRLTVGLTTFEVQYQRNQIGALEAVACRASL